MASEHEGRRRNFEGSESGGGKGGHAAGGTVRLVLPDEALAALGFARGDLIEVLLGDVWQGDLAALLLTSGDWAAGFAFFACAGVRLYQARTDLPPRYIPLDAIATGGRVVRVGSRALLQAGMTLPHEGVDRIRFRFRL